MDAITTPPRPINEPVHTYAPGTPERRREDRDLGGIDHAAGAAEVVHVTMRVDQGAHRPGAQPLIDQRQRRRRERPSEMKKASME